MIRPLRISKDRVVGPLPNGHSWLINGGDPNDLLTGMILQVLLGELIFKTGWATEGRLATGTLGFVSQRVKITRSLRLTQYVCCAFLNT